MSLWNDMIIGLCLLLLVWLLWKELRRTKRSRLPARLIATILAVIGLACLALPLYYTEKKDKTSSGKEGVLLTEGYDPDSLRQFLQTARAGGSGSIPAGELEIFSAVDGFPRRYASDRSEAGDATLTIASKGSLAIGTANDNGHTTNTLAGMDRLARLHVLGYGLTRKEWAVLQPPPLTFHPSPPPAGILSASWRQKSGPGERWRVQGSIQPASGRPTKLLLTAMGIPVDSIILAAVAGRQRPSQTNFELSTNPAQSGRSVYRLYVLAPAAGGDFRTGMDTLEQESLPVEVLPAKKLRILLLAAAPDFENTFLVNWLSRNGHAVATRTAISKGKWDKAFLNMPETALNPLTPSILDKFDLVIADAAALQTGDAAERAGLRRQVADKGMGLIIKADSSAISHGGFADAPGIATGVPGGSAGSAFYKDLFPLESLKDSTQRLYIKERPGTRALLRDSSARVVVSSGIYGAGKLVFTTLNTTYSRMLSGEKKEYAAYWSLILRTAARKSEPAEDWQFTPDLPRVNEPVEALLQTNRNGLPQGQFSSSPGLYTIYLARHPLLPFLWQGTYWPTAAGWQSSATLQGDTCWWYAWLANDWLNITRRQRWKETIDYITDDTVADQSANRRDPEKQAGSRRVPIAKAWFYTLFLLSCLFLWVERKI